MSWGRPTRKWKWRDELDDLFDQAKVEDNRRRGRKMGKRGGYWARQYREMYPQLPPQIVGQFIDSGIRPESQEAQRAALLAIEQLRRENPVPARDARSALGQAALGQGPSLLPVAEAANQLPAGQAPPTGVEDPRALQFAAQSGSMAGGPALSPGGTEPAPAAFEAAISLNTKRDARQRLRQNDPVTWDEFVRIEDLLSGDMNMHQRDRLNELLAGIDPSKRENRAKRHGRVPSQEPYTNEEQRRLNVVAEYQADIRAGREPSTYREEDEELLTEMRVRLAGVTAEDVERFEGDQAVLGPGGERELEELSRFERRGPLSAAAVGDPLGRVGEVLQPVTRGAQVGLWYGYEQLQSGVRETARSVSQVARGENPFSIEEQGKSLRRQQGATTLGQVLQRVGREDIDLGSGYLVDPQSEVSQSQAAVAREQYTVNGHAATPGRLFSSGIAATGLIDPNDKAYNLLSGLVDAGVALSPLDPTNLVLGGGAVARRGARGFRAPARVAFEDAGIVPGVRRFFIGETADQFLAGPKGSGVVQDLWGHKDDFGYVANRLGDAQTAVRFVDAPDLQTARAVIRHNTGLPTLPTEEFGQAAPRLRERPTTPLGGYETFRARKKLSDVRFVAEMPTKPIDILDANEGVMRLDQIQRTAKIPYARRNVNNLEFARAVATGTRTEIIPIVQRTYEQVVEQAALGSWGRTFGKTLGDPTQSRYFKAFQKNMSSIFKTLEDQRLYAVDQLGHKTYPEFLLMDGQPKGLAHPSAEVEFLNRSIPIPDVREIKRMVSWLGPIYRTPGLRKMLTGPTSFMDVVYQQFFKPAALITRFSYPLRVVSEGQMRIAAGGFQGGFNHPLEYFAYLVGRKGTAASDDVAVAAAQAGSASGKHAFAEAMNREVGVPAMLREPGTPAVRLKGRAAFNHSQEGFTHAWAEELAKMNASPTMRTIATIGRAATKEEFFTGSLKSVREDLVKAGGGWTRLADRQYADEYIDWLDEVRVRPFTHEDTDLLDAIRTGKLRGEPIIDTTGKVVKKPRVNPKVLDDLENRRVAGDAPEWAPGDAPIPVDARDATRNAMNDAIDWGFAHSIGWAEDTLNRSPQWRQAYWRNAEEALPYAKDVETAERFVRKAEAQIKSYPDWLPSGLGDAQLERLRAGARSAGQGELGFDHIDLISGSRAADDVKNLLFDLSKRNQFFDTFRFAFPFGDAFREVITRWAKLVPENPRIVYRGTQAISGAQESGIFHEDANGNTVFSYYGASWISQLFAAVTGGAGPGTGISLSGPVQGLNIAGSLLPGVGPAVSISARYFDEHLPDSIEKTFHEFIYPYGEPDADDPLFSTIDSLIPAWLDKWAAAAGSPLHEDLRARTTMHIVRVLYSSGEYGHLETAPDGTKIRMLGEDDVRQLMADAKSQTTRFLLFQGGAQNILPSTPIPQWKVATADGKMVLATEISRQFYKWANDEKIGYDGAIARLINTFGPDAFAAVEGMTESLVYGLEHTERAYEWETEHSGFVGKFPLVAGFFAPREDKDEFDIGVYQLRLDEGQLHRRDPEVMIREAQNALGEWIYDREKENIGESPTDEESAYLRDVKTWLLEDLAGYASKQGVIGKADQDEAIRQLRKAIKDSDVKDSKTAEGIRYYLRERDFVTREAAGRDITNWWTAKSTRDLTEYLRDVQGYVRDEFGPGASQVMDELFGRDVRSAEEG